MTSVRQYHKRQNRDFRFRLRHSAAAATLSALALVGGSTFAQTPVNPPQATPNINRAAITNQDSYADLVARVAPAVVTIQAEGRARNTRIPFLDDPRFREFFGDRLPQEENRRPRPQGVGSGVIVSNDGYVLTNHHVIEDAETIKVNLNDNRTYTAKVIGSDEPSDLAVLKIDATNLPVLRLGNSDDMRVGDVVLAIGNPLDVGQTVTSGIISAKGRSSRLGGDASFEDFLQTDASINRGNSGGALVNTNGELIGINSQILSPTGGSIGIGFAIPSNMARNVMDQLVSTGKVRRGILGIVPQDVTFDIAQALDLREPRGVIVNTVQPNSAAARAGLRQGDVITRLNNQPVLERNSFRNRIANAQPGSQINLTVIRDGREQQLTATLGEREAQVENTRGGNTERGTPAQPTGALGIDVEPLTPEQTRQLEVEGGLTIRRLDPEGPAADAGLQTGDVILRIGSQPVRTTAELQTALARANGRPVLMLISREGDGPLGGNRQNFFITATPRTQNAR